MPQEKKKKRNKRKPFTPNTAVGSTGNPIKEVCTREAHKAAEGPGWATLNPPRRTHGDSGAPQPGTGCEKKKNQCTREAHGEQRTTEDSGAPQPGPRPPQKKKKNTSTVKGSIERQLPPSKRNGRQTTKRGRLTRFTTGKKKKKKQGSRSSQKAHTGPSPKRQREIRGRGLG